MKEKIKRIINDESSGEIMLESTIIMVFVLFILFTVLSVGFLFYQKIAVDVLANNIAADIAASYKDVDYSTDNRGTNMYRTTFRKGKIENKQKERSEKMLNEQISLVSLGVDNHATVKDFKVAMDDVGLMHIEVTIESESLILFGGFLQAFGIEDATPKFTAVGRAQCIDITAYAGQVGTFEYFGRKLDGSSLNGIVESVNNIESAINSLKSILNNRFFVE